MRKSTFDAYVLWLLGFVGLCGLHRFYVRRTGTGLLWLFSLGLLLFGQLIDFFLIPSMVREINQKLRPPKVEATAQVVNVVKQTMIVKPGHPWVAFLVAIAVVSLVAGVLLPASGIQRPPWWPIWLWWTELSSTSTPP